MTPLPIAREENLATVLTSLARLLSQDLMRGTRIVRLIVCDADRPAEPGWEFLVPADGLGFVQTSAGAPSCRPRPAAILSVTDVEATVLRAVYEKPLRGRDIALRLGHLDNPNISTVRLLLATMSHRRGLIVRTRHGYVITDTGRASLAAHAG